MKYLVMLVLYAALVAYCITDVLNRQETSPHGLHKALWVVFILFVPYVGAIFWLVAKFREGRRYSGPRPMGPDDDPDYLRGLRDQGR
jgi:hypothetical protein